MTSNSYPSRHPKSRLVTNHQIRFPEVRVLSASGEQLGVMPATEALEQARAAGKDLILITEQAQPPVVKIIEITKFKYQMQQREAEQRKKSRSSDLKEVRFTPFMGENDYRSKVNKVIKFLERKDKVRLSLQFRGRAITKKEFGYEIFEKIVADTQEVGKLEVSPKLMGKKLVAQLAPIK